MTVKDIIKQYLIDNGFDGLCNPDHDCACSIGELFCDYECRPDCQPAYYRTVTQEDMDNPDFDLDYEYEIGTEFFSTKKQEESK